MECTGCGAALPDEARFCPQCGERNAGVRCPACGTAAAAAARFCASCGTALGADAADPEPGPHPGETERRICSVLFCDLVNFTALAEIRDPEDVSDLLSRYFEAARTVIARYGGVVEKFVGDAVMAVWGTPTAVEGDAERAVRAALGVVEAVAEIDASLPGDSLAVRAGVVTGEVAVNLHAVGQGMVAGDAVNTAARVQAVAKAGEVLVDESTWRVAQSAVKFLPAGRFTLKGKSDPVPLWRAERVLSGVGGVLRIDGLEAPYLGRDAELRTVKELFHACIERRSPRLISVTGAAGVGKTRLSREFEIYVDGLADDVLWHRGRCLSYGEGVAFGALAEIVRGRFGISASDSSEAASEKFAAGLDEWIADPADRDYIRPRLARLLGASEPSAHVAFDRDELFAGWRLFFERLAIYDPVILVIEDLQHSDPGLLEFLEHLLDWSRNVPIFVLTLSRPELETKRPGWGMRRNGTVLTLEPLDDRAMRDLILKLVPGLPDAAERAIAAHSQGIPLYAVETIRMLIDKDVVRPTGGVYRLVGDIGELSVPSTLQSLLAARLDALDATTRSLVADAAVLGGPFTPEALGAVSGRTPDEVNRVLADLVRREILAVQADPRSPERGRYAFVQTMVRRVAYQTMSRRDRKTRHLRVAEYLAGTFEGSSEITQTVAGHLLDAVAALPDDEDVPQIKERAVAMLVRAGERAERMGDPATAAATYTKAAELRVERTDGAPEAALLWESAGRAAAAAGDSASAMRSFRAAAELFRRTDRARDAARAESEVAEQLRRQGRFEEARSMLKDALTVLEADPGADTVAALEHLAVLETLVGGADADQLSEAALVLAESLGLDDAILAQLFIARGIRQLTTGWVQASASLHEAVRLAAAADNGSASCRALANLAEGLMHRDPAAAVQTARAAVGHGRRVGDHYMLSFATAMLIESCLYAGAWTDAENALREALGEDDLGDDPIIGYAAVLFHSWRGDREGVEASLPMLAAWSDTEDFQDQCLLATAQTAAASCRGDTRVALEHASRALEVSRPTGLMTVRWAWPLAADAALDLDDVDRASELLAWLDAQPRGWVSPGMRAERSRIRGRIAAAQGDPDASKLLEDAVGELRRFGSPYLLARGLIDLASQVAGDEDRVLAEQLAAEAAGIAGQLGAAPLLQRLARPGLGVGDVTTVVNAVPAPRDQLSAAPAGRVAESSMPAVDR